MKKINLLMTSLIATAVFFSCSKPKTVSTTITPKYVSLDAVFAQLSVQPKTLTVDAATGGSFFGTSGTRYSFNPNSFVTATGANVTGSVQVQVTECLSK